MTLQQDIALTTHIGSLPGVTREQVEAYARLGIRCVADLILHLPQRYERDLGECTIAEASERIGPEHGEKSVIAVRGEVQSVNSRRFGRKRVDAVLYDRTGTMQLIWFNALWVAKKIHPGMTIRAQGVARRHGDVLQLVNPRFSEVESEERQGDEETKRRSGGDESVNHFVSPSLRLSVSSSERLIPIYPATENLDSRTIARAIDLVLEPALALIEDHLPEVFRAERSLPALADAYRVVHRPQTEEDAARGRRRLAYDDLFLLQLGVMLKRSHRRSAMRAIPLRYSDAIDKHIRTRFPFELMASQDVVVREIAADLQQMTPMNRLLQGDVGSGKTVVALYAMLMSIADNRQAALMAPTELLAEQHFSTIAAMLEGSRVQMTLLTGSLQGKLRDERRDRIESGDIDLIIGTHALLTESVRFHELAVAVIDEQHRFGVHQRATLRAKTNEGDLVPHTLVMTATPIPRTLSLTVFGDLDVSTIHGLPPGRMPIITRVVTSEQRNDVYRYVAERIAAGEQAFIVVPVIDESERGLADVGTHLDWLRKGHLSNARLEAMHGRLDREAREAIMQRFRAGKIDALVATTVIEVGVDIPNATMMVIEHADRFGLAQLHQLRGRVGRGTKRSLCVLIGDPATDDARDRLNAIAATTDGFEIAEKDLEIRGPGELFGVRQAGIAPFRVASIPEDLKLLEMARRDAAVWIEQHPGLAGEGQALLRRRLWKAYGETLGLGDVA